MKEKEDLLAQLAMKVNSETSVSLSLNDIEVMTSFSF
jgi:hypothetical protein